jgi:hypothetical protein
VSAESDFRALLAAAAGVTSLVSTRIAQNSVPENSAFPLIVFTALHNPTYGLDDTLLDDEVTFEVQCWAETSLVADQVADAVDTALGTQAVVTARASGYDQELGMDGSILTIQWWA